MPIKPPSLYASFHLAAACFGATTLSYQTIHTHQLHQHHPHITTASTATLTTPCPSTRSTNTTSTNTTSSVASCPLRRDEPFDVRFQFTACQTV